MRGPFGDFCRTVYDVRVQDRRDLAGLAHCGPRRDSDDERQSRWTAEGPLRVNLTYCRAFGNDRYLRIAFSNELYVDGPLASVFISAVNGWRPSVICPACWRGLGPLALMKSDDPRLRIKGASSGLLTHCGVSDGLRSSRRVVHHVVVALAKLLSLRSPFECVAPDWPRP